VGLYTDIRQHRTGSGHMYKNLYVIGAIEANGAIAHSVDHLIKILPRFLRRRQNRRTQSGKLVAFEGIDNAGKSTILSVLRSHLNDCRVRIVTCEERQSPIACLLNDNAIRDLSPAIKTYLFAADRAWTYERFCLPALQKGNLVLWDRYVDSAVAYRSVEFRKRPSFIDLPFVHRINQPFRAADLTFYVDIPVETSVARARKDGASEPYRPDFLKQVRLKYLELSAKKGYIIINGKAPARSSAKKIAKQLHARLPEMFR